MSTVREIADRYVEQVSQLDPVAATAAGIAGHDDRLPDLSPDGFAGRAELDRDVIRALRRTCAEAAARGRVSARRQVEARARQCADWPAEGDGFYHGASGTAETTFVGTGREGGN